MLDESRQHADPHMLVLDTTALLSDPACSGTAWRVLAHATGAWGIRVLVPAVVLAEAVGGYRRRLQDSLVGLERWSDKHGYALGLGEVADEAAGAIRMRADTYEASLKQVLADVGAEVLPMPEVDHGELVARAIARRRPCDDKGDGYRDTLNWFSLLALLEQNPDAQVVWISENTNDFAGDTDQQLHEHLLEDLRTITAEHRLTWVPRLSDAVAHVASRHVDTDTSTVRQVQDALERETLSTFVRSVLASQVAGSRVSPEKTGLPIKTLEASVADLRDERDLSYTTAAIVGTTAIVDFVVEADALLEVLLPIDQPVPDDSAIVAQSERGQTATLIKALRVEGILEVDAFGRPISGEVRSIQARSDDPGLGPWLLRRTLRSAQANSVDFDAVRKMTEGLKFDQLDAVRKMTEGFKFDQLDAVRKMTEGFKFDQLDAVRKMTEGFKLNQHDAVRPIGDSIDGEPDNDVQEAQALDAEQADPGRSASTVDPNPTDDEPGGPEGDPEGDPPTLH